MAAPLSRSLSQYCCGQWVTIKLYNSETVLVKVVNAKVEREGLAGASHISSSDSVIITGCPPGIELVTTERRDHRHRHHEDVSRVIFAEFYHKYFPLPDQTQHCIFLWLMEQFWARNPVLCEWYSELNDPKIATMRRIMLGSIFTDNWIERLDFDVSIPTLVGLWVAPKWAKDSSFSYPKSQLRRKKMRYEDNCSQILFSNSFKLKI